MNINEFKAWFEGFTEAVGETPTPGQWNKIKTKIEGLKSDSAAGLGLPAVRREYRDNNYLVPVKPTITC